MTNPHLHDLEKSILARSRHRGIHADLEKIRYSIHAFYQHIPLQFRKRALYVGVGHGQDALLALLDGLVDEVIGVDPYKGGGNDEDDYRGLIALIRKYRLEQRFLVEQGSVEDYLQKDYTPVTLVVCCDVLHHIFETDKPLRQSHLFEPCVSLFEQLQHACDEQGMLAVSDVQRHGMRPFFSKRGWLKTPVNYHLKQSWQQWNAAATLAGWRLHYRENYIPFALQQYDRLLQNPIGLMTLCDRYFLHYTKS